MATVLLFVHLLIELLILACPSRPTTSLLIKQTTEEEIVYNVQFCSQECTSFQRLNLNCFCVCFINVTDF